MRNDEFAILKLKKLIRLINQKYNHIDITLFIAFYVNFSPLQDLHEKLKFSIIQCLKRIYEYKGSFTFISDHKINFLDTLKYAKKRGTIVNYLFKKDFQFGISLYENAFTQPSTWLFMCYNIYCIDRFPNNAIGCFERNIPVILSAGIFKFMKPKSFSSFDIDNMVVNYRPPRSIRNNTFRKHSLVSIYFRYLKYYDQLPETLLKLEDINTFIHRVFRDNDIYFYYIIRFFYEKSIPFLNLPKLMEIICDMNLKKQKYQILFENIWNDIFVDSTPPQGFLTSEIDTLEYITTDIDEKLESLNTSQENKCKLKCIYSELNFGYKENNVLCNLEAIKEYLSRSDINVSDNNDYFRILFDRIDVVENNVKVKKSMGKILYEILKV